MDLKLALKYMTDTATDKEKSTFIKWLSQSEANQMKYDQFSSDWDKLDSELKDIHTDEQQAWDHLVTKYRLTSNEYHVQPKSLYFTHWKSIAAAILLLLSGIFFIDKFEIFQRNSAISVYCAHDSLLTVSLIDGSKVCLNKNSELKVPAWKKHDERIVYLRGEAFFDIAADSCRPFLVNTNRSITEVLGTTFNLNSSDHGDVVSLFTGKVKFYASDNENNVVVLKPGEMLTYNSITKQMHKTVFQDNNFIAWKTGKLDFDNTALPEVLKTIAGFYHLKLSGDLEGFNKYSLTANFRNQPVEKVISVLELTWNAQIITRNDTLFLSFK
jgi:transmembrane sensor